MDELTLLRLLLLFAMAVAPLGTHRGLLPEHARLRATAHALAWSCAAIGLLGGVPALCGVWLLFCAGSFALLLHARREALLRPGAATPAALAACVPFLFSNVAAVWLVAGANDLRLLGYAEIFSDYAALHGNVLGWMMVGAIAILAQQSGPEQRVYLASVLVCLVSFLAVAFGIDRFHALKPLGVLGLSVALPAALLVFLRRAAGRDRVAFTLGAVSLGGLALTLALAWINHLALLALPAIEGVRAMVVIHGVLNTFVVAPAFLAAAVLGAPAAETTSAPA